MHQWSSRSTQSFNMITVAHSLSIMAVEGEDYPSIMQTTLCLIFFLPVRAAPAADGLRQISIRKLALTVVVKRRDSTFTSASVMESLFVLPASPEWVTLPTADDEYRLSLILIQKIRVSELSKICLNKRGECIKNPEVFQSILVMQIKENPLENCIWFMMFHDAFIFLGKMNHPS